MKEYSLAEVIVTIGEIQLQGTVDDAISIEHNDDSVTLERGGDGRDNTRVRKSDRSARVTLRLKQGSSTNDLLSRMKAQDELTGRGVKAFQLKDLLGSTLYNAPRIWIVRWPNLVRGAEAAPVEWLLEADEMKTFVGGANP